MTREEALYVIADLRWPDFAAGERISLHLGHVADLASSALGSPGWERGWTSMSSPRETLANLRPGECERALSLIFFISRMADPTDGEALMCCQAAACHALGRSYEPPAHMVRIWQALR